jgi:hypothetical protein
MHASIRRYIVASGREGTAIKHSQDGFMPILQRQPGFIAYYFINTGDGEMIGVSVFDSREGADQANILAGEYVREHLDNALNRTTILEGEVVASACQLPKS